MRKQDLSEEEELSYYDILMARIPGYYQLIEVS